MASNTWRGQNRAPDIFNAIPLNNVVVMNNFHGGSGGGFAGGSFEGGVHHVGIGIGGGGNPFVNPVKNFDAVGLAGNTKNGFVKNGTFDNSKIALDIGGGLFGALEAAAQSQGKWLGSNGRYHNINWGGNMYTGSRAGALKAASNYRWAGNGVLVANVLIGGAETYNGYQMDGNTFGYNTQYALVSNAGGMIGGYYGAQSGAYIGATIGVWFGGIGAIPGSIIGGFIGGFSGSYMGSTIGESSINYYHNR